MTEEFEIVSYGLNDLSFGHRKWADLAKQAEDIVRLLKEHGHSVTAEFMINCSSCGALHKLSGYKLCDKCRKKEREKKQ